MRIGIDIGGVIIDGSGNSDTSFFSNNYLKTPAIKSAHSSISYLNSAHEIFFVSKAYPKTAQKTLDWLENRAFFWEANIDPDKLIFCRERYQKSQIAKMLELDIFIDDRQDICDSMELSGIKSILFLNWESTLNEIRKIARKGRHARRRSIRK